MQQMACVPGPLSCVVAAEEALQSCRGRTGAVVAEAALLPQLVQLLPLVCARVAQALCWGDPELTDAPGSNPGLQEVLADAFGDSNPGDFSWSV